MFKYKELQPFYEKRTHKNLFLTQQDYFDMYVPPGINFWGGDEIGSLFFRTGQYHIVGSNNNIAIYNESKHIKLEQYKTTPTQQEVEDESISIPEVIVENRKNPSPIRYRIFISDDAEKLKFLATNLINGAPKGNEIQVYIEGDQDFLTSKKTYIRIGTRVQLDKHYLDTILNTYTNMQGNEIQALCKKLVNGNSIEENIIGNFSKNALNFELYAFAQGKAIVNKLTQNLSRLKIDFNDATFQDENGKNTAEKYIGELGRDFEIVKRHLDALDQKVLTKLQNTFLGRQLAKGVAIATNTIEAFLKILTEIAKKIAQASFSFVSFIMGFLNGLIDMLIGIIQIIALAGGAILGTSIVINGTTYALVGAERESLLEQLDHFIDSFEGINILETIDELWQNSVQFVQAIDFNAIAQFFTRQTTGNKWYSNISVYEFFYLLGYGSTFLIPTSLVARALGVFGKAGKLIGKILLAFDKVFEKVFNLALKSAKTSLAWLIKLLKAIGEKLKKGTKAVTNGIKEFFEELKRALDDVFGKKWNKLAEGAGARKYKLKSLFDDSFGKLLKVELFENEIRNLPYEAAAFFDEFGNKISKTITQENKVKVEFTTADILSAMRKSKGKLSLTHNHPKSSSISYEDIHMFVKHGLKRLRAVTPNGTNYELILKGKLPTFDEYTSKLKLIRKEFANQNQNLIKRVNTMGDNEANNLLKSKYTDAILEYLGKSVEYINYK